MWILVLHTTGRGWGGKVERKCLLFSFLVPPPAQGGRWIMAYFSCGLLAEIKNESLWRPWPQFLWSCQAPLARLLAASFSTCWLQRLVSNCTRWFYHCLQEWPYGDELLRVSTSAIKQVLFACPRTPKPPSPAFTGTVSPTNANIHKDPSVHPSPLSPTDRTCFSLPSLENHTLKRTRLILSIINLYFDNTERGIFTCDDLPVHYFSLLNSCDRLITQTEAWSIMTFSPPTLQGRKVLPLTRRQIASNNDFVQN